MNLSGGLKAAAQGLQLIASRKYDEADREWEAARQQNLEELRQQHNLEAEGQRQKFQGEQNALELTARAAEGQATREQNAELARIREAGDNARHRESIAATAALKPSAEEAAKDKERAALAASEKEFVAAENDITELKLKAEENGNDAVVKEQDARLRELRQDRIRNYQASIARLAELGDTFAIGQRMSAEEAARQSGGSGGPRKDAAAPGNAAWAALEEKAKGAPAETSKPMSRGNATAPKMTVREAIARRASLKAQMDAIPVSRAGGPPEANPGERERKRRVLKDEYDALKKLANPEDYEPTPEETSSILNY